MTTQAYLLIGNERIETAREVFSLGEITGKLARIPARPDSCAV